MAVASQATNPCSIPSGRIIASNCSLMLTVTESEAPMEQQMTFCKCPLKESLYKSGLKIKKVKKTIQKVVLILNIVFSIIADNW